MDAAESEIWGCRVEQIQNIEVSSVGAALLAAVKVELYQDIKSAAQACCIYNGFLWSPQRISSDRYES